MYSSILNKSKEHKILIIDEDQANIQIIADNLWEIYQCRSPKGSYSRILTDEERG